MLGDDAGMEIVGKLVEAQAAVFARASMDPVSRKAAREAAQEAVTGSYVSHTSLVQSSLTALPDLGALACARARRARL